MTVSEIVARVQQIQNMLGGVPNGMAVSPSDGTDFADSLNDVAPTSSVPSASSTVDSGYGGSGGGGPMVTGTDVVNAAEKYLGVPYKYGGTDPESGLDCSGFVQRAYADLGVKLPRIAKDQATQGIAVPSLAQAQPGDLVAFGKPVSHIGIYVGGGNMVVAPHTGQQVQVEKVYTTPTAIRRVLPSPPPDPTYGSTVGGGAYGAPPPGAGGSWSGYTPPGAASPVPYGDLFDASGAKYGVSPQLLAAVAQVESNYNPDAVSQDGAEGLMQLMPGTAAGLGVDPFQPDQAIDGAAQLLSKNMQTFGSLDLALAAYNAGGGAVSRYNGVPPYAETQAYIPKVHAAMADLAGKGFR